MWSAQNPFHTVLLSIQPCQMGLWYSANIAYPLSCCFRFSLMRMIASGWHYQCYHVALICYIQLKQSINIYFKNYVDKDTVGCIIITAIAIFLILKVWDYCLAVQCLVGLY